MFDPNGKNTADDTMRAAADAAVEHAANQYKIDLNYSEESLRSVEHILDTLSKKLPKGFAGRVWRACEKIGEAEDKNWFDTLLSLIPKSWFGSLGRQKPERWEVLRITMMFGSYVGEVMVRLMQGTWHWGDGDRGLRLEKGEGIPTLELDGFQCWPASRVANRLVNGEEDNIWDYCQMMKKIVSEQRKRDNPS